MKRIGLIANSPEMLSNIREAIEYTNEVGDVEVLLSGGYEDTGRLARDFENAGGRILIARGGHAIYLRNRGLKIPVQSIPFTGNNIATHLINATREWGEFAVIGNPMMVQLTRELERPIGAKIHYYDVNNHDDFDTILPEVRRKGIKGVVGGYDVTKAAAVYGLHSYCVETSVYELITAILEARSIIDAMDRDRYWDFMFKSALDTIGEGVLLTDRQGNVNHANRRAIKLVGRDDRLERLPMDVFAPYITKLFESGKSLHDELLEYNNYKFSASFLHVGEDIGNYAAVVLQEVEYVHKIERKIRQKLANKGLIAKNSFDNIHAESVKIQNAVKTAKQYAVVDSSVLISGETGTGKEMFAQSIHNYSKRADEAFVAVNCATIPANLLESELFGYVEGAFTGAKRGGKVGLFELAHKGTIFLDEIGETSLDMQAQLLRVLEEHEIMRVGDDKVIPVDIRVIAASNRDLKKMVDEGKFRSDFYYRLDVLSLQLPPLRECRENILTLAQHFSERYAARHGRNCLCFSEDAEKILLEYDWPGNVRELKNFIERLVVISPDGIITAENCCEALHIPLPRDVSDTAAEKTGKKENGLISETEAGLIRKVLNECGGNKAAAAKILGISRPTLYRKCRLMEEAEVES